MPGSVALVCLVLTAPLRQDPAPGAEEAAALETIQSRVVELTLDNGWKFLVLPRPGPPVVAVETWVAVGSAQEAPGRTGLAHMLEHMAFRGSDRVGTRDWETERVLLAEVEERHVQLVEARTAGDTARIEAADAAFREARRAAAELASGEDFRTLLEGAGGAGGLYAVTSVDATRFSVSLPSNRVELWCWIESERLRRPVMRGFYDERERMLEERRARIDDYPEGRLNEALLAAAWDEHPYRHPVIGTASDLASASRTDLEAFFREHYVADRVVTAIVGHVETANLLPMLKRYFADIPSGAPDARPAAQGGSIAPPELAEDAVDSGPLAWVEVPADAPPLIEVAWRVPALSHPDSSAVEIAVRLLGGSSGSRLVRRLVHEKALALELSVRAGWPGDRYDNLAVARVVPADGVGSAEIVAALEAELAVLAREGPTAEELAGARRSARAQLLRAIGDRPRLAALLAEYEAETGDWRGAFARLESVEAVTASDVRTVVGRWFRRANCAVAELVPPADPDEGTTEER